MIGLSVNDYQLVIRDFNGILLSTTIFTKVGIDTNNSFYSAQTVISTPNIYIAYIIKDDVDVASSQYFIVQEDEEDTVLFEYTNSINDYDTIFNNNGTPITFQFRLDGGFNSDSDKYVTETTYNRNKRQELQKQYDMPWVKHTLTLGDNNGVPAWVAEKINSIMALDTVTIDEISYIRSEDNVPEQVKIADFYPYFNYTFVVETTENVFYEKKK